MLTISFILAVFYFATIVGIAPEPVMALESSSPSSGDVTISNVSNTSARRMPCHINAHIPGKWTREKNDSMEKSYVCCGLDTNDYQDPDISQDCTVEGMVQAYGLTYFTGPASKLPLVGGHACTCDELEHTRRIPSERERWRWEADNCDMMEWNASEFCTMLGNSSMLLIGDSTMQQTFATLTAMINWGPNRGFCGPQVRFAPFHGLYSRTVPGVTRQEEDEKWQRAMHDYVPDILIASFGPHFTHFGENFTHFESHVHQFYEYLHLTNLERSNSGKSPLRVVWKTNNPGHIDCPNFKEPTTEPVVQDISKDQHGWHLFPVYDEIFRNITEESYRDRNVTILDMYPLYLRPDSHPGRNAWQVRNFAFGDCLHYCIPGALDLIPVLLSHLLKFTWNL
jgi:GDSL/SGNH-like Acyl-Esterase family found in Pmr5 and Cas1p